MKIALVCIAKNEDNYIKEWIDYHKKIGFDDIFIYENNWRCNIYESNIFKIPFDGQCRQIPAYNHFIDHFNNQYEYGAFFDIDEFLVLKKHNNIKDFINEYKMYPAIGINWVLFGNNNLTNVFENEYSVIKRFTKRQIIVNQHIKVITKLNNIKMLVHNTDSYCIDTNKNKIFSPCNPNGTDDIAQLNHYFCKTKPEWLLKVNRGRADLSPDSTNYYRKSHEFDAHNFNETEDLHAHNFMYG